MYGLHNIKLLGPSGGDDADVVLLLEALSERILHSEHAMTMSNIASAMYGFKVTPLFHASTSLGIGITMCAVSEYE